MKVSIRFIRFIKAFDTILKTFDSIYQVLKICFDLFFEIYFDSREEIDSILPRRIESTEDRSRGVTSSLKKEGTKIGIKCKVP